MHLSDPRYGMVQDCRDSHVFGDSLPPPDSSSYFCLREVRPLRDCLERKAVCCWLFRISKHSFLVFDLLALAVSPMKTRFYSLERQY